MLAFDTQQAPGVERLDVTDSHAARAAVTAAGPLDVLANVAGLVRLTHVAEMSLETWQTQLNVNLTAPLVLSQAVLPGLIERRGNIVNVASITGIVGQAQGATYCASQGGLGRGAAHALRRKIGRNAPSSVPGGNVSGSTRLCIKAPSLTREVQALICWQRSAELAPCLTPQSRRNPPERSRA